MKPTVAEESLLGMIFSNNDLRPGILSMLQPEDYQDLVTASIFKALVELELEKLEITYETVSNRTEAEEQISALLPRLMMNESLHASNENYTPEECVYTFRLMKLQNRIDELRDESLKAEREGNTEKLALLSTEQIELEKRRSALLPKAEAVQIGN